jgi:hypothetical protein
MATGKLMTAAQLQKLARIGYEIMDRAAALMGDMGSVPLRENESEEDRAEGVIALCVTCHVGDIASLLHEIGGVASPDGATLENIELSLALKLARTIIEDNLPANMAFLRDHARPAMEDIAKLVLGATHQVQVEAAQPAPRKRSRVHG